MSACQRLCVIGVICATAGLVCSDSFSDDGMADVIVASVSEAGGPASSVAYYHPPDHRFMLEEAAGRYEGVITFSPSGCQYFDVQLFELLRSGEIAIESYRMAGFITRTHYYEYRPGTCSVLKRTISQGLIQLQGSCSFLPAYWMSQGGMRV